MSKKKGMRFNKNKLELQYCPISAIAAIATVFSINSEKYGGKYPDNNWRLGQPLSNHMNSLSRHIANFMSGQDNDQDDGINHLWHALTNIAMAIEDLMNNPELDDRYQGNQVTFKQFQEVFDNLLKEKNDKNS